MAFYFLFVGEGVVMCNVAYSSFASVATDDAVTDLMKNVGKWENKIFRVIQNGN